MSGVKFQDKDTVNTSELSNSSAYIPMVQDNVNKKITLPQIKRDAVAICSTAAATVVKTATVGNMTDFVLINGITVTVMFKNENTASEPTLNVNGTGEHKLKLENQASTVKIGSGCWSAGAILELKYVEFAVTGGTEKYWLILGHNVASVTSEYTVLSDNSLVYNKTQTDSKINTEISGLSGANIKATYEGETDYINTVLTKVGKVKTVNEQEPDENGNIEIDADSTIPSMTTAEYDELTTAEKNDGHIREITDAVGTPIPFAILNDEIKTSSNVLSASKCFNEFGYELGSNENGYYRKWANGLLECWGKSSAISSAGNVTITLPYNFKDTNFSVTITSNGTYYNSTEANNTCVIISESQIKISNGSHTSSQFSYFSIGFWK